MDISVYQLVLLFFGSGVLSSAVVFLINKGVEKQRDAQRDIELKEVKIKQCDLIEDFQHFKDESKEKMSKHERESDKRFTDIERGTDVRLTAIETELVGMRLTLTDVAKDVKKILSSNIIRD